MQVQPLPTNDRIFTLGKIIGRVVVVVGVAVVVVSTKPPYLEM